MGKKNTNDEDQDKETGFFSGISGFFKKINPFRETTSPDDQLMFRPGPSLSSQIKVVKRTKQVQDRRKVFKEALKELDQDEETFNTKKQLKQHALSAHIGEKMTSIHGNSSLEPSKGKTGSGPGNSLPTVSSPPVSNGASANLFGMNSKPSPPGIPKQADQQQNPYSQQQQQQSGANQQQQPQDHGQAIQLQQQPNSMQQHQGQPSMQNMSMSGPTPPPQQQKQQTQPPSAGGQQQMTMQHPQQQQQQVGIGIQSLSSVGSQQPTSAQQQQQPPNPQISVAYNSNPYGSAQHTAMGAYGSQYNYGQAGVPNSSAGSVPRPPLPTTGSHYCPQQQQIMMLHPQLGIQTPYYMGGLWDQHPPNPQTFVTCNSYNPYGSAQPTAMGAYGSQYNYGQTGECSTWPSLPTTGSQYRPQQQQQQQLSATSMYSQGPPPQGVAQGQQQPSSMIQPPPPQQQQQQQQGQGYTGVPPPNVGQVPPYSGGGDPYAGSYPVLGVGQPQGQCINPYARSAHK